MEYVTKEDYEWAAERVAVEERWESFMLGEISRFIGPDQKEVSKKSSRKGRVKPLSWREIGLVERVQGLGLNVDDEFAQTDEKRRALFESGYPVLRCQKCDQYPTGWMPVFEASNSRVGKMLKDRYYAGLRKLSN